MESFIYLFFLVSRTARINLRQIKSNELDCRQSGGDGQQLWGGPKLSGCGKVKDKTELWHKETVNKVERNITDLIEHHLKHTRQN